MLKSTSTVRWNHHCRAAHPAVAFGGVFRYGVPSSLKGTTNKSPILENQLDGLDCRVEELWPRDLSLDEMVTKRQLEIAKP
jgi:hypothetical protein